MKPRYLLLLIVNLLAFNQGLVMDDTTKFYILDSMREEFGMWNLMEKALLDIVGVVLFGYLAHRFGRKRSIISLGIISLLFQIIYVAILPKGIDKIANDFDHPYYYYDIACSLLNSAPLLISTIYIGETAEDCNRGVFVSSFILSNRLGQVTYTAAKFWDFLNFLRPANILLSVVFVAAAFWLPETPLYLLQNNRTEEPKKDLSFLQGNSNIDEGEFQDLTASVEKSNSSKRTIMSSITNPATRKALIIGSVTSILNRLIYTQYILGGYFDIGMSLKRLSSHDAMTSPVSSFGPFLLICTVILTVLLVDRFGRKCLLLVSCAGQAFLYLFADIEMIFVLHGFERDWSKNYVPWLDPAISVLAFVTFHVGCGIVPYILLSELFQTHARVSGITFCYLLHCLLTYFLYIIFSIIRYYQNITFLSVFFTIYFCGFLFTYYYIPETKGKSLQDIAKMLKRQG